MSRRAVVPPVLLELEALAGAGDELPQPGGMRARVGHRVERALHHRQQRELGRHAALLDLLDDVIEVQPAAVEDALQVVRAAPRSSASSRAPARCPGPAWRSRCGCAATRRRPARCGRSARARRGRSLDLVRARLRTPAAAGPQLGQRRPRRDRVGVPPSLAGGGEPGPARVPQPAPALAGAEGAGVQQQRREREAGREVGTLTGLPYIDLSARPAGSGRAGCRASGTSTLTR